MLLQLLRLQVSAALLLPSRDAALMPLPLSLPEAPPMTLQPKIQPGSRAKAAATTLGGAAELLPAVLPCQVSSCSAPLLCPLLCSHCCCSVAAAGPPWPLAKLLAQLHSLIRNGAPLRHTATAPGGAAALWPAALPCQVSSCYLAAWPASLHLLLLQPPLLLPSAELPLPSLPPLPPLLQPPSYASPDVKSETPAT